MADGNFSAGLTDQDALNGIPIASSPFPEGMDLDVLRANPEMLAHLVNGGQRPVENGQGSPSPSAAAAGAMGDAVAPTAPASTPSTPPTPDYAQEAQAGDLRTAKETEDLASQMGTVPASIQAAQDARDAAQARQIDPAQYKPSAGTRIWRGVRGGLVGLSTGGILGALGGAIAPEDEKGGKAYAAPTAGYDKAVAQKQQDVQTKQQTLQEATDNWKRAVDARKAQTEALKDSGTGYGRVATAATDAAKQQTEAAKARTDQQRVDQESPAAKLKLSQDEFEQRTRQLESDSTLQKLSPLNKVLYRLNGKVPDPKEPNEAEVNAAQAAQGLVVYRAQHGGKDPMTPQDYQTLSDIIAARRGGLSKGSAEDEVGAIVADATAKKQEFADKYERNRDGSYRPKGSFEGDPTGKLSAQEFADRLNQPIADANVKLAKKGARIDPQTGQVMRSNPGRGTTTPTTSDNTPVAVGTTVSDGKRSGTVTAINPKTGKPIVAWNP